MNKKQKHILWFRDIGIKDVPLVGGKNASLGEMFSRLAPAGIAVPNGFALTAAAFWYYLKKNRIDKEIKRSFGKFNPKSLASLKITSARVRRLVLAAEFPADLKGEILKNYQKLSREYGKENLIVAVRSSATAEDLPKASFAGQHETYLNVLGGEQLLSSIKKCFASLYLERAIAYREEKGFNHLKIALSVGIQKLTKSDSASSGVMFTLDTETGFPNVVLINSIWGMGEMLVKGKITPDQFYVFKPALTQGYKSIILKSLGRKDKKYVFSRQGGLKEIAVPESQKLKFSLTDEEILTLARWACLIEKHYQMPQDIEWAKDEETGQLFIVQSRPETVYAPQTIKTYEDYQIKTAKKPILAGIAVGNKFAAGRARVIPDISRISEFQKGEVLVAKMTDPDWMPIMSQAAAIITDEGGKTAHAAIVSRELGLPCVVGTKLATKILKTGQLVTVDCTQGAEGRIYSGAMTFKRQAYSLVKIPKLPVKIMVNLAVPEMAFKTSFLPNDGVGLVREEFIIAEKIKAHPLALYYFNQLKDKNLKKKIEKITVKYRDKKEYFEGELAEGVAQIAAAFYPKEVIVRFSDFKTNEYRNLLGGELYEKEESNPMLGLRGASRYLDKDFQPAFLMECRALKKVREEFGLTNISLMVPFCRTPEEGRGVVKLMEKFGLKKGKNGLKVYVMCEIPSNVILADEFLEIFDGMSIGSNDLTQLVLGVDRDNAKIAYIGNESSEAVKEMISRVIRACRQKKKYCGICGDAPSTVEGFAEFLISQKIPSMSLSADIVIKTIFKLAKKYSIR